MRTVKKKIYDQIKFVPAKDGRQQAFPFNISPTFLSNTEDGGVERLRIISLCLCIGEYYKSIVEVILPFDSLLSNPLLLGSYSTDEVNEEGHRKLKKKLGYDPIAKVVVQEEKFQQLRKYIEAGALLEVSIAWTSSSHFPGDDYNPDFPRNEKFKGMKLSPIPNHINLVRDSNQNYIFGQPPYGPIRLEYWIK